MTELPRPIRIFSLTTAVFTVSALIVEFMRLQKAGALNDQNSRALAEQWLQNVQNRLDLWKKYHQQIGDAVSPVRAAQFLQVENQMAIFVDLKIASDMPIVGSET